MLSRLDGFLANGALLSPTPGSLWVGAGVASWERAPAADRLSFYSPDFYLSASHPWLIPEETAELEPQALSEALSGHDAAAHTPLEWREPDFSDFARRFQMVQERLRLGSLEKAVPITEAWAEGPYEPSRLSSILRKLLQAPPALRPYGFWNRDRGLLGATPELLAAFDGRTLRTMALAGTRRAGSTGAWNDAKDQREHELVVRDIVESLEPLGKVTVGERRILTLPTLEHWLTPIELVPEVKLTLTAAVEALHPTPALGVFPRVGNWRWLREVDGAVDRGRFGAPFGASWPDGRFVCVVGIRNVEWGGGRWALRTGCGVIRESLVEKEWTELAMKRDAVRSVLGV